MCLRVFSHSFVRPILVCLERNPSSFSYYYTIIGRKLPLCLFKELAFVGFYFVLTRVKKAKAKLSLRVFGRCNAKEI